jgi:hypothetical protein
MKQPTNKSGFAIIDASRGGEAKKLHIQALFEELAGEFARLFLCGGKH